MVRFAKVGFVLSLLSVSGCSSLSNYHPTTALFDNASDYVGQVVEACGFIVGPLNIAERRSDDTRGLSGISLVYPHSGFGREGEFACFTGTVVNTGCLDRDMICDGQSYAFAIEPLQ
jgi:hypothetical protein